MRKVSVPLKYKDRIARSGTKQQMKPPGLTHSSLTLAGLRNINYSLGSPV